MSFLSHNIPGLFVTTVSIWICELRELKVLTLESQNISAASESIFTSDQPLGKPCISKIGDFYAFELVNIFQ